MDGDGQESIAASTAMLKAFSHPVRRAILRALDRLDAARAADLADALESADDLAGTWPSLTPMARWEWVRWIGATRSEETRAKRVSVSIDKLRGGSRRPCCFDLSSCTDPELACSGKLRD